MDENSPRLRILMNADPIGGVWTYGLDLASALAAAGHDVLLAINGGQPSAVQQAQLAELRGLRWAVHTGKLEWMDDPWEDVNAVGAWLQSLAIEFQPDIIHLNDYSHAALDWSAPVVVVAHSCVFTWWEAVKDETPPQRYAEYHARVSAGLRAANVVIAPTQCLLRGMRRHYKFHGPQVVIPNGRTLSDKDPGEKMPLIFSAGRIWDEAKNMTLLDVIAPELPWPVCLAGDRRHPEDGTASFSHVHTMGQLGRAEVRDIMAQAGIYAAPALYEPFGLGILEAASAGCALVLGDIPTLRELWQDAAIFIDPTRADLWIAGLRELTSSPERRQHLAQCARKRAGDYSLSGMVEDYLCVYRRLIDPVFVDASTSAPAAA